MLRIAAAFALIASMTSAAMAAEPTIVEKMTLAERFAKINADFSTAIRASNRDAALQRMAVGARNEALSNLATAAESNKSTEHAVMTQMYFIIDRFEDAARQAKLAVKAKPTDYGSRQKLILSLAHLSKTDEALGELKTLLESDVATADVPVYLSNASFAVGACGSMLNNNKKYEDAEKFAALWEAKLEKLPLDTETLQASKKRAETSLKLLRSQIASSKKRDELLGKPYQPIVDAAWLNGSELKPDDLRGKVVLIDFWAVWCGPCIATFPHLREWEEKYGDKGLVIIGATKRYKFGWNAETHAIKQVPDLSEADEDAATTEFVKWHKLKHRIAVMPDQELFRSYAVTGIPQAVLIDKQGLVRLIFVGSSEASAKLLEQGIRDALGLKTETAAK